MSQQALRSGEVVQSLRLVPWLPAMPRRAHSLQSTGHRHQQHPIAHRLTQRLLSVTHTTPTTTATASTLTTDSASGSRAGVPAARLHCLAVTCYWFTACGGVALSCGHQFGACTHPREKHQLLFLGHRCRRARFASGHASGVCRQAPRSQENKEFRRGTHRNARSRARLTRVHTVVRVCSLTKQARVWVWWLSVGCCLRTNLS
jgi:hypothetical protein